MANREIIGIDCGATKVIAQSATYDSKTGLVSPGEFHHEINYSDHPNWNAKFVPVHLDIQRQELSEGNIFITEPEMDQGDVIVETIKAVISEIEGFLVQKNISTSTSPHFNSPLLQGSKKRIVRNIGLCFPGIKNDCGVVIMANGPRIPNLLERIPEIDTLYNDSDCCVLGEWKSTIGKMKNCNNSVYIGGGTGIADGIILNGKIIDFNKRNDVKRSWELEMPSGETIESCLSPKGMIHQYNLSQKEKVETLDQLSKNKNADIIFEKAVKAFSFLIQNRTQFFKDNQAKIEKIVIGQRLGIFMADSKFRLLLESKTDIPLDYSTDRQTAALGAAWKRICS
jgi:hypothetical protein